MAGIRGELDLLPKIVTFNDTIPNLTGNLVIGLCFCLLRANASYGGGSLGQRPDSLSFTSARC